MISIGTLERVSIPEISVQDLAALGPTIQVIDVRELNEWESGHVAHAVHVPLATIPEQLAAFSGSPNYLICRSGARSENACRFLTEQGIEAVNVTGGMLAWTAAGFDIESGPTPGTDGG